MNMAFQNFVRKTRLAQSIINYCVIVYMDDILVYSSSYEGHVQHIEWALHALRDAGFKVALEKCQFFLTTISFLGHVVTDQRLQPEPHKVATIKDAPVPTTIMQVRAFLGLASSYRRFIKGFAAIAGPLTNLLRKDQPLIWTPECDVDADQRASCVDRKFGAADHTSLDDQRGGRSSRLSLWISTADRRQLIVQELITPIVQLANDLSPDIVSQSDDSPAPYVLLRSLDPYLQWTACLEEPRDEDTLPSRQEYLKPYDIIPHAFYPKAEEVVIDDDEEDDDEETSEEGSYSEYSEGELSEEEEEEEEEEEIGSEWEARTGTEVEDTEAAHRREEIVVGKCQLEFASGASQRIGDDPTRDPEPSKPGDGDPAAAAPSIARRRQSRSPSSSSPTRLLVRPRTDASDRPSSSNAIPPPP
ncbi:hypothetical protein CBR_g26411 [Chara braunii]|uniref:Reverse transcriptase domain-containing protein n=1 Tax=Chara braunii TaxID=69332 RepID=A0A388L865_CHABU|nr:hypothetical protein CBR_g26411 [Chara braunii]|eukprot:GBG78383.1 hypothetical protein CBR_g26411 [Chara braunii]